MVDVDHLVTILLAQVRRQDLHVARQYDVVGTVLVDQARHLGEGRLLVLRIDRHMEVGNAVPLHHAAQIVVVGDHAGDFAVQLTAVPAVQQVGQTVRLTAGHQHHALLHRGIGDPPIHGELTSDRGERLAEYVQIERQGIGADFMAHEKPAAVIIGMMTGFGDPAVISGQEITHLGDDPNPVRTGDHQSESAHGVYSRYFAKGAILGVGRSAVERGPVDANHSGRPRLPPHEYTLHAWL
ncbi:hypothetical protein D3C76_635580 [compost metagenome]